MNCFRHIEEPAVGTGEVYIGRDSSGEIYGIRPLCKPCFDSVVESGLRGRTPKNDQPKIYTV